MRSAIVAWCPYTISSGLLAEGTFGSVSKPLRYLLYKPASYLKLDVDGRFKKDEVIESETIY